MKIMYVHFTTVANEITSNNITIATMLDTPTENYFTNSTHSKKTHFGFGSPVIWLDPMNGTCSLNTTGWQLTDPVCSTRFSSYPILLFVTIILSIITFCTVLGNFMVLVALYKYKSLRTMSNCLIGNLAVSDFLLALTVLPISVGNDILGYWVFGRTTCTIWLCIDVFYCTASIWGLCTIAFDRYTATIYPLWYHDTQTSKRAMIYIAFVWIFSIIVSFAPFIGWRDMIPSFFQFNRVIHAYECILFMTESYVLYSAFGSFILPLCLMLFIYLRIFIALRKRSKAMQMKIDLQNSANVRELMTVSSPEEKEQFEMQALTTTEKATNGKMWQGHQTSTTDDSPPTDDEQKTASIINLSSTGTVVGVKKKHIPSQKQEISDSERELLMMNSTSLSDSDKDGKTVPQSLANFDKKAECGLITTRKLKVSNELSLNDSDTKVSRKWKHRVHSLQKIQERHTRTSMMTASMKHRFELREQRATKRMALIMACFCFCWMPFLFMYMIRSFCASCDINPHIQAAIIWLGYINSGLNPLLYTIFNEDFRKAFAHIICCRKMQ